jgi:hypothetical protein
MIVIAIYSVFIIIEVFVLTPLYENSGTLLVLALSRTMALKWKMQPRKKQRKSEFFLPY